MKTALLAALAASLAATSLVSMPSFAEDSIVVKSQKISVPKWIRKISNKLDDSLEQAMTHSDARLIKKNGGFVAVSFNCDDNGRPIGTQVSRPSGDRALDRVALRAVNGLATLQPMPASFTANQRFRANIIVAEDSYQRDRLFKVMRKEEARRLRAEGPESKEFALSMIPPKST